MNLKIGVSVCAILVFGIMAFTSLTTTAQETGDATLTAPLLRYLPTAADLSYNAPQAAGDVAEIDIAAVGTALQYTGVVLNGDGANPNATHLFLKVQSQSANGLFSHTACYTGNNGGSFGLGFITLTQQFSTAHMRASRSGSTVTIAFTNVNGGTLPDQTYVCTGAPAPAGDKIGVVGFTNSTSTADNFSDGATVLDTFSFVGALASSGNWTDAAPGMNANGSKAIGGPAAISFFTGTGGPCPVRSAVAGVPDATSILSTMYSFRDRVMNKTDAGKNYISMFYENAAEGAMILARNPLLRFRVAQALWRNQNTFKALIAGQQVTVKSTEILEVDLLIGSFMNGASPGFTADLQALRQGLRNRSLLTQFGARMAD
jgi:hypothetical protein